MDVDEDTNEGDNASDVQITDEGCLQGEQGRPLGYYLTHAGGFNKSDVVRVPPFPFSMRGLRWRSQRCADTAYLGKKLIESFDAIPTGDMSSFL
jgi:hypothetical protein